MHRLTHLSVSLLLAVGFLTCTPSNVNNAASLKKFFDQHEASGTFGMFDNAQGEFVIYNISRFSDSAYLPASTFKIVNSLIGIETGVVKDDSAVIAWDSLDRGRPECNRDMVMYEAFRTSCPPWFQELARRIGQPVMQQWLDTMGYGARYAPAEINDLDSFWLDNSIRITADEQLGLVKKLYFDQLPFQRRTQTIVKRMMLMEDNANYRLSYKTGLGTTPHGTQLGWIIGWIQENKHPNFFVLQVESSDARYNMSEHRMEILKGILREYGFMEGKK